MAAGAFVATIASLSRIDYTPPGMQDGPEVSVVVWFLLNENQLVTLKFVAFYSKMYRENFFKSYEERSMKCCMKIVQ